MKYLLPIAMLCYLLCSGCTVINTTKNDVEYVRKGDTCVEHHAKMTIAYVPIKREGYALSPKTVWVRDNAPNAKYPYVFGCVGPRSGGFVKKYVCDYCNKRVIAKYKTLKYSRK